MRVVLPRTRREDPDMERSDDLAAREEREAAREAAAIGGEIPDDGLDPADRPVYEGGGGEAEGFELAERDLVRNASHDDGEGDPTADAFGGEREADESGAVYGEADELLWREAPEDTEPDPRGGQEETGPGPGIAER